MKLSAGALNWALELAPKRWHGAIKAGCGFTLLALMIAVGAFTLYDYYSKAEEILAEPSPPPPSPTPDPVETRKKEAARVQAMDLDSYRKALTLQVGLLRAGCAYGNSGSEETLAITDAGGMRVALIDLAAFLKAGVPPTAAARAYIDATPNRPNLDAPLGEPVRVSLPPEYAAPPPADPAREAELARAQASLDLAGEAWEKGQREESVRHGQAALDVFRKLLGESDPKTLQVEGMIRAASDPAR